VKLPPPFYRLGFPLILTPYMRTHINSRKGVPTRELAFRPIE
jgi:hypothetical protein